MELKISTTNMSTAKNVKATSALGMVSFDNSSLYWTIEENTPGVGWQCVLVRILLQLQLLVDCCFFAPVDVIATSAAVAWVGESHNKSHRKKTSFFRVHLPMLNGHWPWSWERDNKLNSPL